MATLTWDAAVARVKTLVSDGGNNLFSDAAYRRFVNDAYQVVHTATAFEEDEVLIDSVTQNQHALGANVLMVLHMDYDDVPMRAIRTEELENLDEKWNTRTARIPTHFYQGYKNQVGAVEPSETDTWQVGIWPMPTTVETSVIRGIVKVKSTAFTSGTDSGLLPSWGHEAVALEAAALVLETRGEHRNKELSSAYRNMRDFYIGEMRRRRDDRFAKCEIYIGADPIDTSPTTLLRDRHVNATGRAGAGD